MAVAADIMAREVVTVTRETPVGTVAEMLSNQRFGSLPVVDADGRVLGIVTEEDLVTRAAPVHLPRHVTFLGGIIFLENPQHFTEEAEKILAISAEEIMDSDVPFVHPDTPVEVIATRMLDEDLRRVVVLDAEDRLVGIITRADIVRMQSTEGRFPENKAR
jgi:CBS domain-containing protein